MVRAFLLPLILLSICTSVSPALAGRRVALILGNSAYRHVPQLINPANDSKLMASTLKAAGFDLVDLRVDLTATDMRRALRDFGEQSKTADIAVIYYAGHGIEVEGNNYLIPTDAVLERDTDVYDEALSLDRVLVAVEPAKQLRLVILDACRDNPFSRNLKQASSRSIARGLAKIEPTSPNTLIAFSAKAGSTANDGDGENSPFTQALAKRIATPGLDVRRAFGFVRDDVLKVTNNRQEPYVYGSLGGDDVALVPAKIEPVAAAPAAAQGNDVRKDYEFALQIGTAEGWNAFLSQYPSGFYANLAAAQLKKLAEVPRAPSDTPASQRVAALPPVSPPPVDSKALTRRLQSELARVGCYDGAADGNWTTKTRSALDSFNRRVGTSLELSEASVEAIDAVHGKDNKVCIATKSDADSQSTAKRREQASEKRAQQQPKRKNCFVMSGQSFCQ